jgi:hypothetical protein
LKWSELNLKNSNIIFFTVLISALFLVIVYTSNLNDTSRADSNIEVDLNKNIDNEKVSVQQLKNQEKANSESLTQQGNNDVDISLPSSAFRCFPLTEIQKQINLDVLTKFANENVLYPSSVDRYLTKLDKSELVSEFEAGNASAAYVLGMNLSFSSYNTNSFNPYLSVDLREEVDNQITELNVKELNEAREWLWAAAINGVSAALSELGGTYSLEHDFLEADYKSEKIQGDSSIIENKLWILKAKQLSFNILYVGVAPQMSDLFGTGKEYYENEFEQLHLEDKEKVYTDIQAQWVASRLNIGQLSEIELKVPDEIKIAALKSQNNCIN